MSQTFDNARNLANDAKDDASRFVADAKAEIVQLREKVEALMNDRVTPAVTAVADCASAIGKSATETVRHQADRASEAVHERPLIALGLAALAGFLIGSLIRR